VEEKFSLDLIQRKSLFWQPDYLEISAWTEHIPFAFWLVEVIKPQVIVELGVHNGVSYFSFCQAVNLLNSDTTCYGIDNWKGDEHAGFYDESVYGKVVEYNSNHYSRFSTLVRTSFDESVNYFVDGSIDLLHIDGLHTYEIVKHDFETWLPKLSPDALVIFHDINVRERNFGVFQLWEELKSLYPHFQFDFGHGIGVIAMGKIQFGELEQLFTTEKTPLYFFLRNHFSERGRMFKKTFETIQLFRHHTELINGLNAEVLQAEEKYKDQEAINLQLSTSLGSTETLYNNVHQQYKSLLQSHSELYDNHKKDKVYIEEIEKQLENTKTGNQYIKKSINTLRSINKTQREKYENLIQLLSAKLQNSLQTENRTNEELIRQNQTIRDLALIRDQQNQNLNWYKNTFENRRLIGIIKDRFKGAFKKKPENILPYGALGLKVRKEIYSLDPVQDLKFFPDLQDYAAVGPDPHFITNFNGQPLKAGWYQLSIDVDEIKDILLGTKLYFDYGRGFNEVDVWNLSHVHDDKIETLIRVAHDLKRLRFDPSISECIFHIKQISLTPASQIKVLATAISRYKKYHSLNKSHLQIWRDVVIDYLKKGKPGIREKVWASIRNKEDHSISAYAKWCQLYDTISKYDLRIIAQNISNLAYKPLFSIIMPVYNAPLEFLEKAIESVKKQAYENWELCIADDKSTNKKISQLLSAYQENDKRIKVVFRETNGHISRASNSALELATGDYIVLLDQDDEILPHALYLVAKAINENQDIELVYSDEDKIDEKGNRFDPYFKTDWNRDLFYGQNMINHLGVFKYSLIKKIGGFRPNFEGSQDYDLALRCIEHLRDDQIYHIPHVLYHWRAAKGSTSITVSNKNYALDAGIKALNEHFQRTNKKAIVEKHVNSSYRVKWMLPDKLPKVSIIIPTKDKIEILSVCIKSILNKTKYENYEILIIDNNSQDASTHEYYNTLRNNEHVKIFEYKAPFNFSAINNFGVQQSIGELLVLLNNDTEVINEEWLHEIVSQCLRDKIGVVGAKLYYPNGLIQHAGVFLSEGHPGIHIYLKRDKDDPGYINKLNLVQNYSAVTAACFGVKKEIYLEVGGLDEKNLKVAYNDVDFCLKVKEAGYNNLWTPFAQLTHYESLSRGDDLNEINLPRFKQEQKYMLTKWDKIIKKDPYFNPNLDTDTQTTQFAYPPRISYEWRENKSDKE
jgi:O-antigen biosynthesis protein